MEVAGAVGASLWQTATEPARQPLTPPRDHLVLTDERISEQYVRELEQTVSQLRGVIRSIRVLGHQANNHLTAVAGNAELLSDDPLLPADLRPLADDALAEAQQLSAALARLGRLARMEG